MAHAMDQSDNIRRLEEEFTANDRKIRESSKRACGEADRVLRDAARVEGSGKFKVGTTKSKRTLADGESSSPAAST